MAVDGQMSSGFPANQTAVDICQSPDPLWRQPADTAGVRRILRGPGRCHQSWNAGWNASTSRICIQDAVQIRKELCTDWERGIGFGFWCQEIPRLLVRPSFHARDRPQATPHHSWTKEGSSSTSCCKDATLGADIGGVPVLTAIQVYWWTQERRYAA